MPRTSKHVDIQVHLFTPSACALLFFQRTIFCSAPTAGICRRGASSGGASRGGWACETGPSSSTRTGCRVPEVGPPDSPAKSEFSPLTLFHAAGRGGAETGKGSFWVLGGR